MMENAEKTFSISDDSGAEWAIAKIREAQADCDKWTEFYKQQIEKAQKQATEAIEYMQQLLAAYFESVPHRATKTGIEKYPLPSGELVKKPASVDYERDTDKLLAWAKERNPSDFVKTTETARWDKIKAYIKASGDIPDGVTPVEVPAHFEVKVKEDDA